MATGWPRIRATVALTTRATRPASTARPPPPSVRPKPGRRRHSGMTLRGRAPAGSRRTGGCPAGRRGRAEAMVVARNRTPGRPEKQRDNRNERHRRSPGQRPRRLARRSPCMVRREGPVAAPRGPHTGRRRRRLHPPLRPQPARRAHPRASSGSSPSRRSPTSSRGSSCPPTPRPRRRPSPPLPPDRARPRPRPARVGAAALGCRPCDGARTGRAGSWSWRSSPWPR